MLLMCGETNHPLSYRTYIEIIQWHDKDHIDMAEVIIGSRAIEVQPASRNEAIGQKSLPGWTARYWTKIKVWNENDKLTNAGCIKPPWDRMTQSIILAMETCCFQFVTEEQMSERVNEEWGWELFGIKNVDPSMHGMKSREQVQNIKIYSGLSRRFRPNRSI